MRRRRNLLAALIIFVVGAFVLGHSASKSATSCTEVLGSTTLHLPCAWIEGVDMGATSFGQRLRLRAFQESGKLDDDTHGDDIKIWYESRQDLKLWPALFASFRLKEVDLANLKTLPTSIKVDGRFGHPEALKYDLTVDRKGEEWVIQTIADSNFNPLPSKAAPDATGITWWVKFPPGDTTVPSTIVSCDDMAFSNCILVKQEPDISITAFFSRNWLDQRQKIADVLESITASMRADTLLPEQDAIPCPTSRC